MKPHNLSVLAAPEFRPREHAPEKLADFSDENMPQAIESARFLIDQIGSIRSENALEDRREPSPFVTGKVLSLAGGTEVEIESPEGVLAARRAFSCLVEPIAGDRVLAVRTTEGLYVTAVLDRLIADRATLALPSSGALTIAAADFSIAARTEARIEAQTVTIRSGAFHLASDVVTLLGRLSTWVSETIRLSSRTQEMSSDTISSKSLDRVAIVARADVLQAGTLTQTIDDVVTTTAPIAVIATEEDLRLDGKRVTVG